jgi:hypothetical protein
VKRLEKTYGFERNGLGPKKKEEKKKKKGMLDSIPGIGGKQGPSERID